MIRTALFIALALPGFALAETDGGGTLNPSEMGMERVIENIRNGETAMADCAAGYLMTKGGRHGYARETFETCAEAGYTGAMTWMGYMDNNGFGGEYDPDAAAEWDKRAADLGDPVGQFNHGVNLIRGYGIAQDEEAGRALIDQAAASGLPIAVRLQSADYDLDEITPDADNWRYAPLF